MEVGGSGYSQSKQRGEMTKSIEYIKSAIPTPLREEEEQA